MYERCGKTGCFRKDVFMLYYQATTTERNTAMRRKDREITDRTKIEAIMDRCSVCRIGFYDEGEIYIVPLNFGHVKEGEKDVLYFHGAKEGRKIDLAAKEPKVGFEMDGVYVLQQAEEACSFSAQYESIIGTGRLCLVEDPAEKRRGFTAIMKQSTGREDWNFPDAAIARTAVLRLDVETLSCKSNAPE